MYDQTWVHIIKQNILVMFDCRFEKLANKNKQKGDSNDENKSIREETHAYQNQLRSNKNCKCIIPVIPKNADLKEEGKMNKVKLPIKNEIVENHIKTESDAILKEIETIFNYL